MSDPILTITVTRSAGPDGALVVFLDGDLGDDGKPFRILLNDEPVYSNAGHESDGTIREARTTVFKVTEDDVSYFTGI